MQKYRAFGKLFHMAMNKPMNAYNLRLYVYAITSYENPATYHKFISTVSYKPTKIYTSALTHTKNSSKRPSYTPSLIRLYTIICTTLIRSKHTFIISFITNQKQNHHIINYHVQTHRYLERRLPTL